MVLLGFLGIIITLVVLFDIFETIVLPRRVLARLRLTRVFYRMTWTPWVAVGRHLHGERREGYLSIYGPLSLLQLLAVWAGGVILGYALIMWGFDIPLHASVGGRGFGAYLYMSGTTFLTLGIGDVLPTTGPGRLVTVLEVGNGFGVLALVIGFLPVLYSAFSSREVNVTRLDARAGSPPSAGEILRRYGQPDNEPNFSRYLRDLERWAAELMESHLSYPVLMYYRSQHEDQSWLAALTSLLDLTAMTLSSIDEPSPRVARLTFATARHAAVDLCRVLGAKPLDPAADRLPPEELAELRASLVGAGVVMRDDPLAHKKLRHLRAMYEPYVNAMSLHLAMPLPPWSSNDETREYWKSME
jgi:hypothetical protein